MNWISNVVRPKIRNFLARRDVPENLWIKCPESGQLVFFNEAAQEVFGQSFAEVGETAYEDWSARFSPRDLETDETLPLERRPTGIALNERRADRERYIAALCEELGEAMPGIDVRQLEEKDMLSTRGW